MSNKESRDQYKTINVWCRPTDGKNAWRYITLVQTEELVYLVKRYHQGLTPAYILADYILEREEQLFKYAKGWYNIEHYYEVLNTMMQDSSLEAIPDTIDPWIVK